MARKRNDLGPEGDAIILAGVGRYHSAGAIAAALVAAGIRGASRQTVDRRIRELRGRDSPVAPPSPRGFAAGLASAQAAAPPAAEPPLPDPEHIPEDATVADVDVWLQRADEGGKVALERGDLGGFGAMGRLTQTLLEHKRKVTPPPRQDPNESPDMVAAATKAREMLHKCVSQVEGR